MMTNLQRVISSEKVSNHPTNDPAENMQVSLIIHIRVDTSGTGEEATDKFIRFRSIEEHALTTIVRKEVEKMVGAYYSEKEMEALLNPDAIQEAIFEDDADNKAKIEEMENRWGVSIGVVLDASIADEATKQMKRTPARGEALLTTINKLVKGGLSVEQARRAALSLDDTADFSERQYNFDINAPHLKNLRDINIMPGAFGGNKKGGKK